MMQLLQHPELYLYEGTYLKAKGIKVRRAEDLSKCFILVGLGQSGVAYVNTREYESATGIMRRFGQVWFARDSLDELDRHYPRMDTREGFEWYSLKLVRAEYHFDSFIIFMKSGFDFIAHLISQVLKLGYQGKNVDLSRRDFRAKISKECPELGTIIDRYSPWIIEATKYRKAIEHQKAIPPSYFNPDEFRGIAHGLRRRASSNRVLRFPEKPITITESIVRYHMKRYRTRPVLPYCDSSLKKMQEIVEKTFEIACQILRDSKPVKEFREAREETIRSSYEKIDIHTLDGLTEFTTDNMQRYLSLKFPKRGLGLTYASTAMSDLFKELREAGISTYRELDKAIDDRIEWFLEYERTHPPFGAINWSNPKETRKSEYGAVGVTRSIVKEVWLDKTKARVKPN